jgi:hypothetical protein
VPASDLGTEVGLFVEDPLPFEAAWPRRLRADLGVLTVSVAGLADRSRGSSERAGVTEGSGWEEHRESQRRAWLRLSYAERLRWLDQAKRFATRAIDGARRRRERAPHA